VANTLQLLEILDEHATTATFFVLGSGPAMIHRMVRRIQEAGHEVAAHGYSHIPVYLLSPNKFRQDVLQARQILEDVTGERVRGYRAPYFSVTRRARWAIEILSELGFDYDASVFPVHRRYYRVSGWDGAEDDPRFPRRIKINERSLLLLPATTLRLGGQNLPVAGGVFLGLLPYRMFMSAICQANGKGHPAVIYLHPHDLDGEDLGRAASRETWSEMSVRRLIAIGRNRTARRLCRLLADRPFTSVREWLDAEANPGMTGTG